MTDKSGCVTRSHNWWVLRSRERVTVNGVPKVVHRAQRICRLDQAADETAARELAEDAGLIGRRRRRQAEPQFNILFSEFLELYMEDEVRTKTKISTQRNYRQMLDRYIAPRVKDLWLQRVGTREMQNVIDEIFEEHQLGKRALLNIRHFLSGAFSYAMRKDFLDSSGSERKTQPGKRQGYNTPMAYVEIPVAAKEGKETGAYELEEILTMLRLLDLLPSPDAAMAAGLAAWAALRKGELQGLFWEHYTPPTEDELGWLQVTESVWHGIRGTPKTASSKASVPVLSQLSQRLAAYRKAKGNPRSGPILDNGNGKPRDLDALYRRQMESVLAAGKIPWLGWHGFRRGAATNLHRMGIDDLLIMRILRHKDVETTQGCYIKTNPKDAADAMRKWSAKIAEVEQRMGGISDPCSRECSPEGTPAEKVERVN